MTYRDMDRRHFLRTSGALSVLGAAAPFALQLAAAGEAAAASAAGYKALVCIFLFGGNDAHNTVLATDADSWGRYFSARNTGQTPIALMPAGTVPTPVGQVSPVTGRKVIAVMPEAWGGVLPITPATAQPIPPGTNALVRTFGLHPFLAPLQTLFNRGRLAVVANVGTLIQPTTKAQYLAGAVPVPPSLYSHIDQQSLWQCGALQGHNPGWGGAVADLMVSSAGANATFTAVSPAGNTLFLSGRSVRQYVVDPGLPPAVPIAAAQSTSGWGPGLGTATMLSILQDTSSASHIANDYAAMVSHSLSAASVIDTAVAQVAAAHIPAPPVYVSPLTGVSGPNSLAQQLQTVAAMIAAAPGLGLQRQVFFVSLSSFDTHLNQNLIQPDLLGQLGQAMAYFDGALSNIGGVDMSESVTTFTASDFGRTFTTNGTGTDHAWGSHHFVMGGAVKGGNIYGQFPTLGVDLGAFVNPDMAGNALVPTLAVDQYAATLAAWLGVGPSDLATIFPNLQTFTPANLNFV